MKNKKQNVTFEELLHIGRAEGRVKISEVTNKWRVYSDDFFNLIKIFFNEKIGIEISYSENDYWLNFKDYNNHFLSLTTQDWLELCQILSLQESTHSKKFSFDDGQSSHCSSTLKNALYLLNHLERCEETFSNHQKGLLNYIENKKTPSVLSLEIQEEPSNKISHKPLKCLFVPRTITHLEGHLTLVGEKYPEGSLQSIPLKKVLKYKEIKKEALFVASSFELEKFISAIRSMNEREVRLILKIQNVNLNNLFPKHHFLGKPCLITSPRGDLIWAAYVEPCNGLYDWIMKFGKFIEILDPIGFKENYLQYCEEKIKKIA